MKKAMAQLRAQLAEHRSTIDRLADASQMAGAQASFDALVYIDELKVLYATAHSAFNRYMATGDTAPAHLEEEVHVAFRDLHAALEVLN